MSLNNKIEKTDLARVALYEKVNAIAEELDIRLDEQHLFINEWSMQNKITNCITEIPQDIKLELNNGTITLKAGSKVYIPNGTGVFDEVVIENDLTHTSTANVQLVLCVLNGASLAPFILSKSHSGSTPPVGSGGGAVLWYDTANNKIKISTDNGATWKERRDSLPIAIVTADGTSYSSIDQVFNGFGYIGGNPFTIGFKGLVSDGYNQDGTYKNIEAIGKVSVHPTVGTGTFYLQALASGTLTTTLENRYYKQPTPPDFVKSACWEDTQNNVIWKSVSSSTGWTNGTSVRVMNVGKFVSENNSITSFTTELPFRAADYQDVILKQDKATAVNYDNITNCITEIPQDIKLELNNGTLTLKAGSKVYIPNGVGVFDEVIIKNDINIGDVGASGSYLLFTSMSGNGIGYRLVSSCYAGVADTGTKGTNYYNTSTNIITSHNSSGDVQATFPFVRVTFEVGTGVVSIDQVFNGFGYIGRHNYILPGVKLLISKGYNEDGSYKNQEYTINQVLVSRSYFGNNSIMFFRNYGDASYQVFNIPSTSYLGELSSVPNVGTGFQWYYNTTERLWYQHEAGETSWKQKDYANIGVNTATDTKFKGVFRAVDYNDIKSLGTTITYWD